MSQEIAIQQQAGAVFPRLSMPRAIASAIADNAFSLSEWTTATALERMGDADRSRLPSLAEQAAGMLVPVRREWLEPRLSTMYLAMAHDRDPDRATAWLHEMIRLLSDLPQDIAGTAIDEAVKKSERGFLPSVGAIRAVADPLLDERRVKLERLRRLAAAALAPDAPKIEEKPFERCSPEDAAAIMAENGIGRSEHEKRRGIDVDKLRGPKSITVADYVALGLSQEAAEAAIAGLQGVKADSSPHRDRAPTKDIGAIARKIAGDAA